MAWNTTKRGKKYCVTNSDTGRSKKCFNTITEAESFRRVLASTNSGARSAISALKKKVGPKGKTKSLY